MTRRGPAPLPPAQRGSIFLWPGTVFVRVLVFIATCCITVAMAAPGGNGSVTVSVPNGYARVVNDDLRLQSAAGTVRWMRVWDGLEWKFNPHWESLSQSWKNLTGSQTADSGGATLSNSNGTAGPSLLSSTASTSGGGSSGCWVWVDEDWTPSVGSVLIGGPGGGGGSSGPTTMQAIRTTPFNRVMGEAAAEYLPPMFVSVDYASLCGGVAALASSPPVDLEGIRRQNELYLGSEGRYAFSNRAVLEKRAVRGLPPVAAAALAADLADGSMDSAPVTIAKGYRWMDKSGDWIDYNVQGQVVAYGDTNDNTVWLARDTSGVVRGVVDDHGRVLLSLHYTGPLITEVRDYPISGATGELPARSIRYQYDTYNRLTTVTDARGNLTRYQYDNGNHIVRITDPEGRVEQLAYTGDSVVKRTAADGAVTDYAFSYDDANQQFGSKITGPETPAGRKLDDLTHNRSGKLVRRIVNGRTDEEVRYDTAGRVEYRTNARGFLTKVTRNEYDQVVRIDFPDGASRQFAYSGQHLRQTEEADEAGVKTQYAYDTKGNLTRKTEAAGTPAQRVTEYQVNARGQVVQLTRKGRTEADGVVTADATWQIEYDAQGQIAKTVDPERAVRVYRYDRAGNLVAYTDPLGHTLRYEVDADGNLIRTVDALGRVETFDYDKAGNLIRYTDARGKATQAAYDAANRRVRIVNPVGGTYWFQYNGQGLPVSESDEDGRTETAEFDNFLRLTKQVDALGNRTEYDYNVPDGSKVGSLGALYEPTETRYPTFTRQSRYDQRERATSETLLNPNQHGTEGLVNTATYDPRGLTKTETDPNGKTRFYSYDALGQMTEFVDSLGNRTQARYDARGNLTQIIDANGHVNRFTYDLNDRVTEEILPLGQTTRYTYDAAGNLAQRVDPNGHKSVFVYDAANRLVEVRRYQGGTALVRTTTLQYDDDDHIVVWSETDATRPEGQQIASGTAVYDAAGRKTGETVSYPTPSGGSYSLGYGYEYSAAGYKTRLTWADGTPIDYGYSAHGELQNVTIPGEGIINVSQYKWRAPAEVLFPGGGVQQKTYDGLLNLESLKVKTPGQQTVLDLANDFGKVLELKSRQRTDTSAAGSSLSATDTFAYDDEIRLREATIDVGDPLGTTTESFTLDAVGNRIAHSKLAGAWTYDANNRLLQKGTGPDATRYSYDDNGNLIEKEEPGRATRYVYDTQNRLIEVKDGSGNVIARYGYDLFDQRIWREQYRDADGSALAPARRTYYLYADEGLIAEARQDLTILPDRSVTAAVAPAIETQYGPRPDNEFGTGVLFIKTGNSNGDQTVAYYHHDHLGAPIKATDNAGSVVWAASYDAFGRAELKTPSPTPDHPVITSSLRLPGQVEDPESGLHYNFRRYYDPEIGRYITQDPIGMWGGDNRYRYAEANPTYYFDPTGEILPVVGAYALCMAECMLMDAAGNAITGECNNFGNSAKDCAIGCAMGMGVGALLGQAWKWGKRAWDALPCSFNSFAADTPVHFKPNGAKSDEAKVAAAGLRAISEIKVGDEVLAFSEWKEKGSDPGKDDRLSYEKVTNVFTSKHAQTTVRLTLDNGDEITATEGHPIRTVDGWRDAVMLQKGEKLLLKGSDAGAAPTTASVSNIQKERRIISVYNLEVANAHTYFTGRNGILTHNAIPGGCNKIPGIYRFVAKTGKEYIGKAADLAKRLAQHEKSGLLPKGTMPTVQKMPGSTDLQRRIAEQTAMNKAGGPQSMGGPLQNAINSIAPGNQAGHGIPPIP